MSKKPKKNKSKNKSNKYFNMFKGLSVVDQMSVKNQIKEISDSLPEEVKESFDDTVDKFYNGEDCGISRKDLSNSIKELKEEGLDLSDVELEDLDDIISDINDDINKEKSLEFERRFNDIANSIYSLLSDEVSGNITLPCSDEFYNKYLTVIELWNSVASRVNKESNEECIEKMYDIINN